MQRTLLAVSICVLALVIMLLRQGSRTESEPSTTDELSATRASSEAVHAAADSDRPAIAQRSALQVDPRPQGDLRLSLSGIAALDLSNEALAEESLRPLLLDPRQVREALRMLVSGELRRHPDFLSQEEIGAIRLVWYAVAVYNTSKLSAELEAAGFPVDARAFTEEVLRALGDIQDPAATTLARLLATLSVDGRQIIDKTYLELLRSLAAIHAAREELYAILLAVVGYEEDLEFDFQFLDTAESPKVLAGRLITAFEKADPAQALQILEWIQSIYAGADKELQEELAGAVAAAAPVELAAPFLAERATQYMIAEFHGLGSRAGAQASLAAEYNRFLASGGGEQARTMIVSGLAKSGTDVLLGILDTDPSPKVRGQALLSATFSPDFAPTQAFLDRIREAHRQSGPHSGAPGYSVLSAAKNLLLQAEEQKNSTVVASTVEFLRELALSPSGDDYNRSRIPQLLKDFLPPSEWESFSAAVHTLTNK